MLVSFSPRISHSRRLKVWLKRRSGDDDMKNFPNWDQEFQLEPWPEDGLFDEYLEMGRSFYNSLISPIHSVTSLDRLVEAFISSE